MKISLFFLSLIALGSVAASAQSADRVKTFEYGYTIKCEPTELADIQRTIRAKVFYDLEADPSIVSKSVTVKVRTTDKMHDVKSIKRLNQGNGLFIDTKDLSISIGGKQEGHACYAKASVVIKVSVTRKGGEKQSNEITGEIMIPGSLATGSLKKLPLVLKPQ